MEASRKPLAKVEGRKRLRLSGVTVAYRGTPSLDDWCAYIVNGTKSRKLHPGRSHLRAPGEESARPLQSLSKKEVEKLAKG